MPVEQQTRLPIFPFHTQPSQLRENLGDLAGRDHDTAVFIINTSVRRFVENRNGHSPNVDQERDRLQGEIVSFRNSVDNYLPQVADAIRERYHFADVNTYGTSMNERLRRRLGTQKLNIVTDVDGTITQNPKDYLLSLPGSAIGEELLTVNGRETFPDVFASTWQEALRKAPSLFKKVGQGVPIREGVREFIQTAKQKEWPITALSANFLPFVEGVFDQIPEIQGSEIIAITSESLLATDKGSVLRYLAIKNNQNAAIFIGDGGTDLPSLDAHDVIAWYYALEGSVFAKELALLRMPHSTYRNFHDIRLELEEIKAS